MQSIADLSILIVESNSAMRTQLRNMVALCGITKVSLAVTAGVAIRKLREMNFDIIICEYHLGEGQDGQHLLEDLRQHHLIPLATVFLMVTGESLYDKVVSTAELAPNDYILKPFSSDKLLERLLRTLQKRDAFLPTYRHIEAGNLPAAIEAALQGEQEHVQYLVDFKRLRAELLIAAGNPDAAKLLYEEVLTIKAVPWAKLGLAKSMFMLKQYEDAEKQLANLVDENSTFMDAYDWLAKTREAAGKLMEAQEVLQDAVKVSPHTVRRLRKLGEVSNELGDHDTAIRTMSEVVRKGKYSDFREPEDHVLLVKAQLGKGDLEAATATVRDLERSMDGQPKAALCKAVSEAMLATKQGDSARAQKALEAAMQHNDPRLGASLGLKKDLARICIENERDEQAAEVIMDVMRHAANDAEVDRIKGVLIELGRPELAENLATRIRVEVREIMTEGAQLAQSGDYEGAVRQMMQAVHKLPGNTHVLFNAALALLKSIEHEGWNERYAASARDYIDRVRKQDPGNDRLNKLTDYYHNLVKRKNALNQR